MDKVEAIAKTIMLSAECRKRDSIFSLLKYLLIAYGRTTMRLRQ